MTCTCTDRARRPWVNVTTPECARCGRRMSAAQVSAWLDSLPEAAPERTMMIPPTTTRIGRIR